MGEQWFYLCLLHYFGKSEIVNVVLLSTSRKGCCKTGKDAGKSHSNDMRTGKCALWFEIYGAQSV